MRVHVCVLVCVLVYVYVCVCVLEDGKGEEIVSWKLIGDRLNEINRRGFYEIIYGAKYELNILSFYSRESVYVYRDVEN